MKSAIIKLAANLAWQVVTALVFKKLSVKLAPRL